MKLLDCLKPGKIYLIETVSSLIAYDDRDIIQVIGLNKFRLLASTLHWIITTDTDRPIKNIYENIDYPIIDNSLRVKEITISEFPLYMDWKYIAPEFYKKVQE